MGAQRFHLADIRKHLSKRAFFRDNLEHDGREHSLSEAFQSLIRL